MNAAYGSPGTKAKHGIEQFFTAGEYMIAIGVRLEGASFQYEY